ncbi:MAG TPA: hypothetical protein VNN09_06485 [Candidatus Competibacteraceae bacterium]|nr:hypothetical protein [Candidatus Competibacteraceae bacterium]
MTTTTLTPQTPQVQLSNPIEINGAKVGYLTMREPVWDDIIARRAAQSHGG